MRCQTWRGVRPEAEPVITAVLSWQERERVLALQVMLGAVKRCLTCEQMAAVTEFLAGRHVFAVFTCLRRVERVTRRGRTLGR